MPVSPGFSREGHSRPHSQIGFIKFMVRPLYASLASVAPLELKPMQDNLEKLEDFCARPRLNTCRHPRALTHPFRPWPLADKEQVERKGSSK